MKLQIAARGQQPMLLCTASPVTTREPANTRVATIFVIMKNLHFSHRRSQSPRLGYYGDRPPAKSSTRRHEHEIWRRRRRVGGRNHPWQHFGRHMAARPAAASARDAGNEF